MISLSCDGGGGGGGTTRVIRLLCLGNMVVG